MGEDIDFIAQAQHIRAEHDATHGEAEMCGGECIVLGLTDDDEAAPGAGRETDDIERLRRQNHEYAERRDREAAALQSRVDHYENAMRRAREQVRGTPVDWTNDPPSQKPDGWWSYTSQSNRDILTAAVHDLALAPGAGPGPDLRAAAQRYQSAEWAIRLAEDRGEPVMSPEHSARVEEWRTADRELRAALATPPPGAGRELREMLEWLAADMEYAARRGTEDDDLDRWRRTVGEARATLGVGSSPDLRAAVEAALTSEDEIAHGEAYEPSKGGLGACAYCDDEWPCRTQRGIDRLRAALATRPPARLTAALAEEPPA